MGASQRKQCATTKHMKPVPLAAPLQKTKLRLSSPNTSTCQTSNPSGECIPGVQVSRECLARAVVASIMADNATLLAGLAIIVLIGVAVALFVGIFPSTSAKAAAEDLTGASNEQASTSSAAARRTTARNRMRGAAARRRQAEDDVAAAVSGESEEDDEDGVSMLALAVGPCNTDQGVVQVLAPRMVLTLIRVQ
eukprot:320552-Chlamydomonas_euryale.AAC.39